MIHSYHNIISILLFPLFSFLASVSFAAGNGTHSQQVLLLVGFDGTAWYPYTLELPEKGKIESHHWQKKQSIADLFSITRQPGTGDFFVKNNSGTLQRFTESGEYISDLPNQDRAKPYTQLRACTNGLVMVQLLQGKSSDTQLIKYTEPDEAEKNPQKKGSKLSIDTQYQLLNKQVSSQFHPLVVGDTLYYGHVSCRQDCNPVIQEIWKKSLITGSPRQLTLLNATTYLHSVSADGGKFGFLSSNKHGYYHIARLDIASGNLVWLTSGHVTDSFPSIANDGALYFIRFSSQGTQLMKFPGDIAFSDNSNEEKTPPVSIALPENVQKIRYLELSNK
jgi:hypothetical protein